MFVLVDFGQVLQAVQLDFYAQERRIFWVDAQVNELKRVGLIGSPIETVVDTAITRPNGIIFYLSFLPYP